MDTIAPLWIIMLFAGALILMIGIWIALVRWIFKIEHIAKRLDEMAASLRNIADNVAHSNTRHQ
jgi:hypothetical protein